VRLSLVHVPGLRQFPVEIDELLILNSGFENLSEDLVIDVVEVSFNVPLDNSVYSVSPSYLFQGGVAGPLWSVPVAAI